jgi:hypothetical protein
MAGEVHYNHGHLPHASAVSIGNCAGSKRSIPPGEVRWMYGNRIVLHALGDKSYYGGPASVLPRKMQTYDMHIPVIYLSYPLGQ